jgi:class 3 adenylate cyclase
VEREFIGDAVAGSFGVTRAQDDAAEQAIRAGLDIVASVPGLGTMFGLGASELQVRVGVNTGEVLITGDSSAGWQLTDDVVNVTARVQSLVRPGAVLETARPPERRVRRQGSPRA